MMIVRQAKSEDYQPMIKMLNKTFKTKFPKLLPKLYRDNTISMLNHGLVEDNSGIIGAIAVIPNILKVDNKQLIGYGVGMVGVKKQNRGQGIMGQLLSYADNVAKDADLMYLTGHRSRYQRNGYVVGGNITTFTIDNNNLPKVKTNIFTFSKLIPSSQYFNDIARLQASTSMHWQRQTTRLYDILTCWHNKAYAVLQDNKFVGYISMAGNCIQEILLISNIDIYMVVSEFYRSSLRFGLKVNIPSDRQDYLDSLFKICENFCVEPISSFKILNFKNLISVLLNYKASYCRLADGVLILKIEDNTYKIEVADNIVNVADTNQSADVVYNQIEATIALTSFNTIYGSRHPLMSNWFPLPLYIPHIDNV